jgi:Ni/Fe-hydrogenase subunit HybB-like protein
MNKKTRIILWLLGAAFIGFALHQFIFGFRFTGINNAFPWGAWVIAAQALASIGDGAFITAFLFYIFRRDSLKPLVPLCLLAALLTNIFASLFMFINSGQPLRVWNMAANPAWHGRLPESMLTAAFFAMPIYFVILCIELVPLALTHAAFEKRKNLRTAAHYMEKLLWIPAAASFFFAFIAHGSFGGGIWESMEANPLWYREYPRLFLVGTASAAAGGAMFIFCAASLLKAPPAALASLLLTARRIFIAYFILHIADISILIAALLRERSFLSIWGGYYGIWILIPELCVGIAAVLLMRSGTLHLAGALCGIISIVVGKCSLVLQGFSIPKFPWDNFTAYVPLAAELITIAGALSLMALIYGWAIEKFKVFPRP